MASVHHPLKQHDARELASGYSRGFRRVEVASIVTFAVLETILFARIAEWVPHKPWLVGFGLALSFLGADFVSGCVHWLADTWGTPSTPLLGKTLIRPFREHHVDEKAITRHDVIETNGANCLVSLGPAVLALLIPLGPGPWLWARLLVVTFTAGLILFVMGTNQFHKWSHMDRPPRLVAWLQRVHLVLPPEHHAIHHQAPFNTYYCITTGWLNWPLHKLRFFRAMEAVFTATLGWLPRQDDLGERAARALVESEEPTPPSLSGLESGTARVNGSVQPRS